MIFICYYYYRHNYFLLSVVRGGLDGSPSAVLQSSQTQQRCVLSKGVDNRTLGCYNVNSGSGHGTYPVRKEKIMKWSRGSLGTSLGGRIIRTRRGRRKPYCKNCIHCLLTEHGTEMYCKKYKRFKSIRQSKKPSCLVAR